MSFKCIRKFLLKVKKNIVNEYLAVETNSEKTKYMKK